MRIGRTKAILLLLPRVLIPSKWHFLSGTQGIIYLRCMSHAERSIKRLTENLPCFFLTDSGYVCVPMAAERLDELQLPLMVPRNTELMKTAYTVSVDYIHGTTTGISAQDRALTARKLADPTSKPEDFSRPGHILPLRAVKNGVLERFGHTEAAVDLCKLAGKPLAACIGELVKEDDPMGSMARRDDCFAFAKKHNIKMITIKDLTAYRKRVQV